MYNTIQDIPQFPHAGWQCNMGWDMIEGFLDDQATYRSIEINPDFQRGYVWTQYQKERYIEHRLRSGIGGRIIYFNCPNWDKHTGNTDWHETMVLVDGKQRLNAVQEFLRDNVRAFGKTLSEYGGPKRLNAIRGHDFIIHVNTLQTKREVIEWYLGLNAGGSVHTEEDLAVARALLK